jgi:hypothetical protein
MRSVDWDWKEFQEYGLAINFINELRRTTGCDIEFHLSTRGGWIIVVFRPIATK